MLDMLHYVQVKLRTEGFYESFLLPYEVYNLCYCLATLFKPVSKVALYCNIYCRKWSKTGRESFSKFCTVWRYLTLIERPGAGELVLFDKRTRIKVQSSCALPLQGNRLDVTIKQWTFAHARGVDLSWKVMIYIRPSALVSVQSFVCWSLLGGNSWSVLSSLPCLTSLVTNWRSILHVRAYCWIGF